MNPSPRKVVVLGASANRSKFGNKAVRAYQSLGATVWPVNPKEKTIEGLKVFASLSELPEGEVDRLLVYLPPQTGLGLLEEIAAVAPKELWFNPGSESEEILAKAKELGLDVITACSIVTAGLSPTQFSDD